MSVPYNPFEPLNLPLLKDLIRHKTCFLVVQRLQWPGIPDKKGFIGTPYHQERTAKEHAQKLDSNEGRLIDLRSEMDKILGLIDSSRYLLYLSSFTDPDWEDKILKHYQKNIHLNLKVNAGIQALEDVSIQLSLKLGIMTAVIRIEEVIQEIGLFPLLG